MSFSRFRVLWRLVPFVAAGLALGCYALPAAAPSDPYLHINASGLVHNYPTWPADTDVQVVDAATGPIMSQATAGNVISAYHPGLGFNPAVGRIVLERGLRNAPRRGRVERGCGDLRRSFGLPEYRLHGGARWTTSRFSDAHFPLAVRSRFGAAVASTTVDLERS
jgi:hypothetical protein